MGRPSTWTPRQLARLEELVVEALYARKRISWVEHAEGLGHLPRTCADVAKKIRSTVTEGKTIRRMAASSIASAATHVTTKPHINIGYPKPPLSIDDHRISMSTQMLATDAELRGRIEVLGVTGGLLGDPMPGRSALDEKRVAAIAIPAECRRRPGRGARIPGVAARLSKELR